MKLELFAHNQTAYEATEELLARAGRAAIVHPTGTGKSFIGFKLCEQHPDSRVCWLSPSEYIFRTQVENLKKVCEEEDTSRLGETNDRTSKADAGSEVSGSVSEASGKVSEREPNALADNVENDVSGKPDGRFPLRKTSGTMHGAALDIEILRNVRFLTYARLMGMGEEELEELRPAYIILDEFHRCGAQMWGQGVQRLLGRYPEAKVLGLSATSVRYLDNQRDMAQELFGGNVASEMTLGEAVVRGILSPPKYIAALYSCRKDLEHYLDRVKTIRNRKQRDEAEAYLEALRRALEKADGLDVIFEKHLPDPHGKYLVFCANAEHMGEMKMLAGEWFGRVDRVPHIYSVYSEDPGASSSFAAFKEDDDTSHLRLLYCIDALNEGIHVEGIDGVILLRPTVSPIIYKQQIGRALAAGKKKEPVIFDIVNNIAGLYSISSLEEEMKEVVRYYQLSGDGREIVNESFRIIDEVRDCRKLFEELETVLSASWDYMYAEAKNYFEEHGDLLPLQGYVTEDGLPLGQWVVTQRNNYRRMMNTVVMTDATTDVLSGMTGAATLGEEATEKDMMPETAPGGIAGDTALKADKVLCLASSAAGFGGFPGNVSGKMGKALAAESSELPENGPDLRKGSLTAARIRKLEAIGMDWRIQRERQWEDGYSLAEEYYRQHGDLNATRDDGPQLAWWLARQRQKYRDGVLETGQQERLDRLGMVWEYEDSWEEKYRAAEKYYREHGNLDIPASYVTEDGLALGAWHHGARSQYRLGQLPKDRQERLEAIGMDWEPVQDRAWMQNYEMAKEYYRGHGNLDVHAHYVTADGMRLGGWISSQRSNYKKGTLTEEQKALLEAIGMDWQRHEKRWDAAYACAEGYYRAYGNLNPAASYVTEDGFALGAWVATQRKKYGRGKLKEAQVRRLEKLHILWDVREEQWQAGYEHAEAYYREYGNLKVETGYVAPDGFKLGAWVGNKRQRYRRGKLEGSRARQLETLGVVWPGQAGKRNRQKTVIAGN